MAIYRLRKGRLFPAFSAGAALGAAATASWLALTAGDLALVMWPVFFVAALIVWSIGLLTVGTIVWTCADAKGWRSPLVALAGGGLATGVVALLLQLMMASGERSLGDWISLALLALLGALVGLVIQRIAYRREPSA